jgi:hypothetical protein
VTVPASAFTAANSSAIAVSNILFCMRFTRLELVWEPEALQLAEVYVIQNRCQDE